MARVNRGFRSEWAVAQSACSHLCRCKVISVDVCPVNSSLAVIKLVWVSEPSVADSSMRAVGWTSLALVSTGSIAIGLGRWWWQRRKRLGVARRAEADIEQCTQVRSASPFPFEPETAPMLPAPSSSTSPQDPEPVAGNRRTDTPPPPVPPRSPQPPAPPPKDAPKDKPKGKPKDVKMDKAAEAAAEIGEGSGGWGAVASSSSTHESPESAAEQTPHPEEISRAIAVLTQALRPQTYLDSPTADGLEAPQLPAEIDRAPTYRACEPPSSSPIPEIPPAVSRAPSYREREDVPGPSTMPAPAYRRNDPGPTSIVVPQPSRAASRAPSYRERDAAPPQYQSEWRGSASSLSSSSSMRSERSVGGSGRVRGPRGPRTSRPSLKR